MALAFSPRKSCGAPARSDAGLGIETLEVAVAAYVKTSLNPGTLYSVSMHICKSCGCVFVSQIRTTDTHNTHKKKKKT